MGPEDLWAFSTSNHADDREAWLDRFAWEEFIKKHGTMNSACERRLSSSDVVTTLMEELFDIALDEGGLNEAKMHELFVLMLIRDVSDTHPITFLSP
jgi:hypothetical protein